MSEVIKKTKRQAFTWDPDFRPVLKDLEYYLLKNSGKTSISNLNLFMLCLGIGFEAKVKRDVPPRRTDSARLEHIPDQQMAAIKAVAIADTKGYLVLQDEDAVYDIVEQYAAGGLMILANEMTQQKDFGGWLSAKLYLQAKNVNSAAAEKI